MATSEPPIVPDASPELNVALAAVWELCELHLRKSGEFLPFGGILRNDGAFDVLFGDTEVTVDGLVSGAASRELVIEGLKRRAPYLPGEVVVIARNVRTKLPSGEEVDAVLLHLEEQAAASDLLVVYTCRPGEVTWVSSSWGKRRHVFDWV